MQCVAVCCGVLSSSLTIVHIYVHGEISGVLQCVAVCCNVLQCVALLCSVLQRATVCCLRVYYGYTYTYRPKLAVCCSVVQCVATYRNVSQCVAAWRIYIHRAQLARAQHGVEVEDNAHLCAVNCSIRLTGIYVYTYICVYIHTCACIYIYTYT